MADREKVRNLRIPDFQLRMVLFFGKTSIPFGIMFLLVILATWILHWVGLTPNPGGILRDIIFIIFSVAIAINCIVNYPSDPKVLEGIFKNRLGLALFFHYALLLFAVLTFQSGVSGDGGMGSKGELEIVALCMLSMVYPDPSTVKKLFAIARAKFTEGSSSMRKGKVNAP